MVLRPLFSSLRVSRCHCILGWKDEAKFRTGEVCRILAESKWGMGEQTSEDLSVTALLDNTPRNISFKQSSVKQLVHIHFIGSDQGLYMDPEELEGVFRIM